MLPFTIVHSHTAIHLSLLELPLALSNRNQQPQHTYNNQHVRHRHPRRHGLRPRKGYPRHEEGRQLYDYSSQNRTVAYTDTMPVGAAIDWLGNNADKSIEELKEDEGEEESPLSLQPGEQARSLLCKDCGKKFRSTAQAEFHANKTYAH